MDHRPLNDQIGTRFPKTDGSLLGHYENTDRFGRGSCQLFKSGQLFVRDLWGRRASAGIASVYPHSLSLRFLTRYPRWGRLYHGYD